ARCCGCCETAARQLRARRSYLVFREAYLATGECFSSSRFTLHASRFTLHASRFTLHASRFTLHASRFTLHASRITLHASRFTQSNPPHGIPAGAERHIFERFLTRRGHGGRRPDDVGGLVAPAALRLWRQEWGVRFHQEAVCRYHPRH